MRDYLRRGDGFVDIGANIGTYTIYAASLIGRNGTVESFEPDKVSASRLRENIALNKLTFVRVHEVAVGDVKGFIRLTSEKDTKNHIVLGAAESSDNLRTVSCIRLDDELTRGQYAMGKMDVEGAELLALQGAERMLAEANPPVWLLEVNGLLRRYGFSEVELRDWLNTHDYDLVSYEPDTRELCWSNEPWKKRPNLLALARSAKNKVLERIKSDSYANAKGLAK